MLENSSGGEQHAVSAFYGLIALLACVSCLLCLPCLLALLACFACFACLPWLAMAWLILSGHSCACCFALLALLCLLGLPQGNLPLLSSIGAFDRAADASAEPTWLRMTMMVRWVAFPLACSHCQQKCINNVDLPPHKAVDDPKAVRQRRPGAELRGIGSQG